MRDPPGGNRASPALSRRCGKLRVLLSLGYHVRRHESQGSTGGAETGPDPNYVWDFGWIKILGGDPNVERQPHEGWIEGVLWTVPLSRLFK
jgi:hypothetical protein